MTDWLPVLVQVLLGLAAIRLLTSRVLPDVGTATHPQLFTDVWLPVVLVTPLLFTVGEVEWRVGEAGWVAFGGPAWLAIAAFAAAAIAGGPTMAPPARATVAWVGTGVFMLLLGWAHDVTVWMAQCALAVGAVMLWINSPAVQRGDRSHEELRHGGIVFLVFILALAQGFAILLIPAETAAARAGGAVALATGAGVLLGSALTAGPRVTLRIGAWTAVSGFTLALGILALRRVLPHLAEVARSLPEPSPSVPAGLAYGFGFLSWEAVALIVLGTAAVGLAGLRPVSRRILGVVVALAAVVLAGVRLGII